MHRQLSCCRAWTLFHFEFKAHPPVAWLVALSVRSTRGFFAHHYIVDLGAAFVGGGTAVSADLGLLINWRTVRSCRSCSGLLLVTTFIWFAENIGTLTKNLALSQPARRLGDGERRASSAHGFCCLIISYTLVVLIKRPRKASGGPPHPHPESLRSIATQCVSKERAAQSVATSWFETLTYASLRQAPHHEVGRSRAQADAAR